MPPSKFIAFSRSSMIWVSEDSLRRCAQSWMSAASRPHKEYAGAGSSKFNWIEFRLYPIFGYSCQSVQLEVISSIGEFQGFCPFGIPV